MTQSAEQRRLRRQLNVYEKMLPQLKAVVDDPKTPKPRKIEGQALINRVTKAIENTKIQL